MRLQPGTPVTANVRLERPLAQGAMGSVWLAEHLTLNTKVAVKFISDRLDPDDPEVLERFIREATAAAQIKSSHVVQTFDQGVMRDGTPYIVMEYLEGEGLGARLARLGRLPVGDTLRIVQQSAKALGSAHKAGIIHRDIKPDNIFLSTHDDELHVKIFDFGIAKHRVAEAEEPRGLRGEAALGLTNAGVMIGTPEYMSPEQVMSASAVDHRADLWALAVVAYVCTTGRLPFEGNDVSELCLRLFECDFVRPSALRPELPAALDAWFDRAFARTIEARFQSAREMAQALAMAVPSLAPEAALTGAVARGAETSLSEIEGDRSLRGATFSGAATDASRRGGVGLSPSVLGAFAVALLAVAGGALFVAATWGAPSEPAATDRAAAGAATPDRPEDEAAGPPEAALPSEEGAEPAGTAPPRVADDARAEGNDARAEIDGARGSDAATDGDDAGADVAAPTNAPPPPRPWPRPPRKNPGF